MISIMFILIQRGYLKKFIINYVTIDVVLYSKANLPDCLTENLSEVPIKISNDFPTWNAINNATWVKDIYEGFWRPQNCSKNESIAIIIPYRDRDSHLRKLLGHLHPFLQKQKATYQIFVIEQSSKGNFNKGAISNAGFQIANSLIYRNFSCFIFHDVDLLPIKYRNIYQCREYPLHLASAINLYQYELLYDTIVGGVLALTKKQFIKLNGYSNIYEGWGGEDDDMTIRIIQEKYKIMRYSLAVGQYDMIKHKQDKGNPRNKKRHKLLTKTHKRYKWDGVNNAMYQILQTDNTKSKLVYWVLVEVPILSY